MALPTCVVVDTYVATTANGMNEGAPPDCVASSGRALTDVMERGHVFVDEAGLIVKEYRNNLSPGGQPGPGNAFLKWLLTHEWGGVRVTRVPITPSGNDAEDFDELPPPTDGTIYDPSDRKFLAVTAADPKHPTILQSFDSKWWGWHRELEKIGVTVHFLCPEAIEKKYRDKMPQ